MAKILIVEDDTELAGGLCDWLVAEHHLVDRVADGKEALHRLRLGSFDLIILDWSLPDLSGIDVCRQFRSGGGTTPILMLTGRDAIKDKTAGLDAGADDYLTKPFHPDEFSSRVRALLRRPTAYQSGLLKLGDLSVDPTSYQVKRLNKDIRLLPKEFALLEFMMRHPNVVFSAQSLIDRVWSTDSEASADTVRQYISRLRNKIEVEGQPQILITVHGLGYKLEHQ